MKIKHTYRENKAFPKIISFFAVIAVIFSLVFVLKQGFIKHEQHECLTWQSHQKEAPHEATSWQIEQCKQYNIDLVRA